MRAEMKTCFCTQKGPKAVGPYSTAVVVGDMVYMSGMLPLNPADNKIVDGGIEAQAVRAFENIALVLQEMGLGMENVVKVSVFMTNLKDFAAVNAIYKDWFGPNYPARSCVQVAALPMGAQIEVEITAVTH